MSQISYTAATDGDAISIEIESAIAERSEVAALEALSSYHPDDDEVSLNRRLHILEQKTSELELVDHTNWIDSNNVGAVTSIRVTNPVEVIHPHQMLRLLAV